MSAKTKIVAPPSPGYISAQKLARTKELKGKGNRTAAETQELVDNLVSLLPPDALA